MGKYQMRHELMINIHKELLQQIRERENHIWKFWGILISALGSVLSGKYLEYESGYTWLFFVGAGFALIILYWGMGVVINYGYHHRMFQKVLFNIEKNGGLVGRNIIPKGWNPCKNVDKLDLPGLYKVHFIAFYSAFVLVSLSSLCVLYTILKEKNLRIVGIIAFFLIIGISLYYYKSCCCKSWLRKKMDKICV